MAHNNILANCALYYYRDLAQATAFYQQTLGFALVEDYGFGKLFQIASTSYLMLVDASIGRHSADIGDGRRWSGSAHRSVVTVASTDPGGRHAG